MFAGKKRMGQRGRGKGLVCISLLRVCFLVSVLVVKGGIKCTLVVCSISLGASRIVGLEIWAGWFVGCWLQLL